MRRYTLHDRHASPLPGWFCKRSAAGSSRSGAAGITSKGRREGKLLAAGQFGTRPDSRYGLGGGAFFAKGPRVPRNRRTRSSSDAEILLNFTPVPIPAVL